MNGTGGPDRKWGRVWVVGASVLAVVAAGGVAYGVLGRDEVPKASVGASVTPSATGAVVSAEELAEQKMAAGIDVALKGRAAALQSGTLAQFLAYSDPKNVKQLERDRQVFANLRLIGMKQVSYLRQLSFTPELRPKLGKNARAVRVKMLTQIAGIDPAPRLTQLGFALVERGGRWLVVDDDDAEAGERGDGREPWEIGPIEVSRGRGVLVISSPGDGENGRRLVKEALAAVPAVQAATKRAQAGILVVAMAGARSWDQTTITGGHPADAVAIPNFTPTNAEATEYKVTASRIVINPTGRKKTDRFLLAHEFVHAAMAPLGDGAPIWLVEGYAEYVQYRLLERSNYSDWVAGERRQFRSTARKSLVVLPIDGVFHGDYDESSYGIAWIIVEHLVKKYGQSTVNAFYAELAKGLDDPALRDQALLKYFKLTDAALVAAVKKAS
ncbi:hypothetical protein [Kribbella sp. CA-293567]|uniref:hypothetical protein n=1 Tax=Kribbella sp. CA-293567 TaxID=3002436 RepID=UPI0022DDE642|nr:hypothetical protein [Kribbella sp. CA-293567]WBQ06265.1 hypothetical protein OX958_05570 [Kribbella sp. CA-293567]